jgi:L,D-transpeptidase YcbB
LVPGSSARIPASYSRFLASTGVLLTLFGCADCAPTPDSRSTAPDQEAVGTAAPHPPIADVADAIRIRLHAGSDPLLRSLTHTEQIELAALYEPGAHAPLWIDIAGKPTVSARKALNLLQGAANEGLDPTDYASASLRALATALDDTDRPSTEDVASFDAAMSAGTLRYFRHLHLGRVDPRTIGFKLSVPADPHDFVMLLRSALADDRIAETAAELAPPLVQYRLLRSMLARYRSLATDMGLDPLPPFAGSVRLGESYTGLHPLHRRLVAFGDLPLEMPAPDQYALYDDFLVEGVKRFQIRHGLLADGILGKATHAALTVPLAWRVRQIELALERLRWLPDLNDRRFVALNIPMFHFWGWDSIPPTGEPAFGMRAIVGRALSTQTPVFVEEMRYVIFRPYWNVPRSILRNEILPILERDLDYLRRQDMEIVPGPGDDAQPVGATPENLELLRQGVLRLRQRPGPQNALGLVKFVFPNNDNIYLHGTPAQELFSRARRDFSHGCVRVEDPVSLAEWVLKDQPQWTRDRILAAMAGSRPQRVNLTQPVQVILFYTTAVVMPEDGTVRFAEDIYDHDTRLDRALGQRRSEQ